MNKFSGANSSIFRLILTEQIKYSANQSGNSRVRFVVITSQPIQILYSKYRIVSGTEKMF